MTVEQAFRESLISALRRELIGPEWILAGPDGPIAQPTEVLQESPVQRYSAGVLFPSSQLIDEVEGIATADQPADEPEESSLEMSPEEEAPAESERDAGLAERISDAYDETVRLANEFFPSAIGLTFVAEIPTRGLLVRVRAAVYRSQAPADPAAKLREWHRAVPALAPASIMVEPWTNEWIQEVIVAEDLNLRTIYHRRTDGAYLVTVSLLNMKPGQRDKFPSGADCYFQVGFDVVDPEGAFVFHEYRASGRSLRDPEEASLELLYRNRRSYAAGHGCSAEWGAEQGGEQTWSRRRRSRRARSRRWSRGR